MSAASNTTFRFGLSIPTSLVLVWHRPSRWLTASQPASSAWSPYKRALELAAVLPPVAVLSHRAVRWPVVDGFPGCLKCHRCRLQAPAVLVGRPHQAQLALEASQEALVAFCQPGRLLLPNLVGWEGLGARRLAFLAPPVVAVRPVVGRKTVSSISRSADYATLKRPVARCRESCKAS